ncbi:DNA polymerase IV [Verrucomicrobiota bacterium]
MELAPKLILHVDMDAFFAAVEQHDNPELRGRPVVVGSPPDKRGVVSTCSYEARKFGIHSAMPSRTAYQRCKHAVFVPVRMARYQEVSAQIMQVFESFTPLVEPLSIDEAFLDVTGAQRMMGTGEEIAQKLKDKVLQETGLTCSVGVAPNKFLAKLASDMNKPDGLTVVPFDSEQIVRFLAPLPIARMWGAGPKTQKKLQQDGIRTLEDLQKASETNLRRILGEKVAHTFTQLALGRDTRDVETGHVEKSISNEVTFPEDEKDRETVRRTLLDLIEKVGGRMRAEGYYAGTVHVKIRWSNFQTITRQKSLSRYACDDHTLRETALELFEKIGMIAPVRLIGFGVSKLSDHPAVSPQLDLFAQPEKKDTARQENLSRAVDKVRNWFGRGSIRRGSSLK